MVPRCRTRLRFSQPTMPQGGVRHATGVGDTILNLALSPRSDPWLLGIGPTFVLPTANLDRTGHAKWQVGPVGAMGYRSTKWLATAVVQQWWSVAGRTSRSAVSVLNLQHIASYSFGDGWSIGTSPTTLGGFTWPAGDVSLRASTRQGGEGYRRPGQARDPDPVQPGASRVERPDRPDSVHRHSVIPGLIEGVQIGG